MIETPDPLDTALDQIASFKGMLEAMQRHLADTQPGLIPLVSEGYERQLAVLQAAVCDYLLRTRPPKPQAA